MVALVVCRDLEDADEVGGHAARLEALADDRHDLPRAQNVAGVKACL